MRAFLFVHLKSGVTYEVPLPMVAPGFYVLPKTGDIVDSRGVIAKVTKTVWMFDQGRVYIHVQEQDDYDS